VVLLLQTTADFAVEMLWPSLLTRKKYGTGSARSVARDIGKGRLESRIASCGGYDIDSR